MILLWIFIFIFGTIIGSFLNVVIFRHGTGMGLGGRSRCMTSGKVLRWYELVPIVSFLLQGGRSLHTGAKLSWQYPLVEFLTGLLFLVSFQKSFVFLEAGDMLAFNLSFVFLALVSVFIILISVYDAKHMIIPNEFAYPFLLLAFVSLFVSLEPVALGLPSWSAFVAGPLVALPFLFLWFISKGKWMGFADVKLALAIGWFLGLSGGLWALLISFWVGALFGIGFLVYQRLHKRNNHHIPFGPFLLTGLILVFLYNINIETFIALFI